MGLELLELLEIGGQSYPLVWQVNHALQAPPATPTPHPSAIVGGSNQLRQQGSGTADDHFTPFGADAAELLGRVQEILAACKDPRMHLG